MNDSVADSPIIFLGGLFLPSQKRMIEEQSIGFTSSAADALQKALLRGLVAMSGSAVTLINLPFIGSYPRLFRRPYFPAVRSERVGAVPARGMGFLNVRFVKVAARFFAALRGLISVPTESAPLVMIYSANLPFMAAAALYRLGVRGSRICLVLPDLPEFMADGGFAYRTAKRIETAIFSALARRVDYFVVLTPFMAERIGIEPSRFVVVEGIFDEVDYAPEEVAPPDDPGRRSFLYSGSLAARYGILDLLEAFERIEAPDARLWICGSGDAGAAVADLARRDRRVRYLGQLPRDQVLGLQGHASVLVNPRPPTHEFTRYSFPSKTMEYMGAGKPVIMHRLPGVPDDYLSLVIAPTSPDGAGLEAAMRRAIAMSDAELAAIGAAGRHLVTTRKNPMVQCAKILEMVRRGRAGDGVPAGGEADVH